MKTEEQTKLRLFNDQLLVIQSLETLGQNWQRINIQMNNRKKKKKPLAKERFDSPIQKVITIRTQNNGNCLYIGNPTSDLTDQQLVLF